MPCKLGLSYKESHIKNFVATCCSDVTCEVVTQTDDYRTQTVDATTQTDDIPSLPGITVNSSSRIVTRPDTLHLLSPMPGSCVVQYPLVQVRVLEQGFLWILKTETKPRFLHMKIRGCGL